MPSQSPMKGSTKYRTSNSPGMAGTTHHGHARQNVSDEEAGLVTATLARSLETLSDVTGVFVVGCAWFNELSFDRRFRSLYHLYAITLRIVLNFVHDVVDKQDAAPGRLEKISRIARVGYRLHVEACPFIFNRETGFLGRQLSADPHQ